MTLPDVERVSPQARASAASTDLGLASRKKTAPVTIIMSNYNQAQYLHESLSGLVNQSLPAERILVIDDGSTDNSVDIIRDFERGHANLRLIRNKLNLGLQDSIARALPLVDTDYLVWAASDDILLPPFLEKSMAALQRHPEAGLCFSDLTVLIDETGEVSPFGEEPSVAHIFNLSDLPRYMPPEAVLARMKRSYFPVSGNTVVVRRAALSACGDFFKELQWHSDHFAFNVVAMRFGACVVPNTLGLIRQRADSYSAAGMHNILIQRPVLNAMLDILERDEFVDIRKAFAHAPSYYNVWGTTILRLMPRRIKFWPTAINFAFWKFREYCQGHNLTRFQALRRISARILKRILPKGPEMKLFGRKRRELEAQIERLKVERDGLDADRNRLRQVAEDAAAQREEVRAYNTHLARDMDDLRSQMKGQQSNIDYLMRESEHQEKAIAEYIETISSQTAEIDKQAQTIRTQGSRIAAQEESITAHLTKIRFLETELEKAQAELVTREAARAEAEQARLSLQDTTASLRKRLDEMSLHDGPVPAAAFASGTNLYAEDEPRPAESVLITTMPKAGTYYLSRMFSEGLGLRPLIVSNQYFPEDTIYQPRLREFFRGGYVSQDHFPATPINMAHLGHLTEKIVVHVRDPRQATLSYIHFLDDEMFQSNLAETNKLIFPTLPQDFFERDFSGRLNWGVDHWMPELIAWVEQWMVADQTSTVRVHFTRYEDMVEDREAFTAGILEFLDIPESRFSQVELELNAEVHFRKGETDEWRGVFTEQQSARANGFIHPALAEKFSWHP